VSPAKKVDRQASLNLLDDCLNRIRRAQTSRRFKRENAERSKVFLPALSLSILGELHRHGPQRMKVVAERLDIDVPQVSREVKVLVESGHVSLGSDAADGRVRVVQLTALGAQDWTSYRGAARAALGDMMRDWDDDRIAEFARLFDQFLHIPSR
jgi:DNA-binding MarR family transcriptional regulator